MGILGRVHSVETFGTVDGPGLRYVLFLQGCSLRCKYCHNPDSWKLNCGQLTTSDNVIEDVLAYGNFISNGGLTVSGGEPLLQSDFVEELFKKAHQHNIHSTIDTAGSVELDKSKNALKEADLVLLDIKSIDNKMCWSLTSQGNENTLATLEYLQSINKPVWIRHVLVPGWTLEERQLRSLATYLSTFSNIEKIELLPFHKMGEYKYESLGYNYTLKEIAEPTEKEIENAHAIFEEFSLPFDLRKKIG
jgi:pyruvate formate lyase activating enzyme